MTKSKSPKEKSYTVLQRVQRCARNVKKDNPLRPHLATPDPEDLKTIGAMVVAEFRRRKEADPPRVEENGMQVNSYPGGGFIRHIDGLIFTYFRRKARNGKLKAVAT